MPSAPVVVVISGLFLLSHQFEQGRLIAVAPRIPCPAATATKTIAPTTPTSEWAMRQTNVEGHAVTLFIPRASYVSNDFGWTPTTYTDLLGTTIYYRLDGERVRFIPSVSPTRGIVNESRDVTGDLALPHRGCCRKRELWDAYLPSSSYRLAAAVVDLSFGHLLECNRRLPSLDTEVQFDNGGTLTIELTKPESTTKRIVVRAGASLAIRNLPLKSTPGALACGENPNISHVDRHASTDVAPLPDEKNHQKALAAMVKVCEEPDPGQCPDPVVRCPQINTGMTVQCSNNQWP